MVRLPKVWRPVFDEIVVKVPAGYSTRMVPLVLRGSAALEAVLPLMVIDL
jgi:hypothetical protein